MSAPTYILPSPLDELQEKGQETAELEHIKQPVDQPNLETESRFASLGRLAAARVFWKSILWAFLASVGALFDGYAIVIPGSIVANKGFIATFGTVHSASGVVSLDAKIVGAWGGVQSAGQIVSMWSGPFLSDRFGRKSVMYMVCLWVVVAAVLEITATNWRTYLFARLFSGLAVGLVQSGITVYISEVSIPQIRGTMLAMYSIAYNLGGLGAAVALQVVSTLEPGQFRNAFYSQFVFLGLFLPLIPFIPESPWYYARRHEHDKAKKTMTRLYGNVQGWDAEEEYQVLQRNLAHSEALQSVQKSATILEIFKGINGRRTFISWFPLAFQQFCGLSLVSNYSSYFFGLAGITWPFLASLILKVITNIATIVSFFTVEIIGRRPSLMGGATVMAVCMLLIGVLQSTGHSNQGIVIVVIFAIHVTAFNLSCGPLGWTFVAETSTPRLRAKTTGFAAGGTAAFGLLFNYTTPIMLANPGANWGLNIGYFWFGLTVLSFVVIFFFIPETKGRTYNELDELFERKIPARQFSSTKTAADDMKATTQTV